MAGLVKRFPRLIFAAGAGRFGIAGVFAGCWSCRRRLSRVAVCFNRSFEQKSSGFEPERKIFSEYRRRGIHPRGDLLRRSIFYLKLRAELRPLPRLI